MSPLYVASQMGHNVIVDLLLENGADAHLATVSIVFISVLCTSFRRD